MASNHESLGFMADYTTQ